MHGNPHSGSQDLLIWCEKTRVIGRNPPLKGLLRALGTY
jgi:hypothetical protein